MQKVIVAEIGRETTVVNAFGNLDTENPLLLGQGRSPTSLLEGNIGIGLSLSILDLEKDIGPVSSYRKIPIYATSSLAIRSAVQGGNGQYFLDAQAMQKNLQIVDAWLLPTQDAIAQAAQLIYEEVGEVLVLDVEGESTDVYSISMGTDKYQNSNLKPEPFVQRTIEAHLGHDWEMLSKSIPETLEELTRSAELTAAAISFALQRHIGLSSNYNGTSEELSTAEGRDFSQIRWIVGTGAALTELPNPLEIMRESIMGIEDVIVPHEGIAMLVDKNCIMASLGVLTTDFRQGAWQLLRESFGVEN